MFRTTTHGARAGASTPVPGAGAMPTADHEKQYATLRAHFAFHGHTLHRTSPTDGAVTYYAERWCLVRYLPTLDDARRFLVQIGGTP